MLLSLNISDNMSKVFLDFIKDLDFVKIERSELSDEDTMNMVSERLEEYKKDPSGTVDAREALQRLKIKHGF